MSGDQADHDNYFAENVMTEPQKESKSMTEKISDRQQIAIGDEAAWGTLIDTIKRFGDLVDDPTSKSVIRTMFSTGYSDGFCDGLAANKDRNKAAVKVVEAADDVILSAYEQKHDAKVKQADLALRDFINDYRTAQPAKKESK